jgi:DHA2 family metal-tetracycline-proton antiporter-like MFS transporter
MSSDSVAVASEKARSHSIFLFVIASAVFTSTLTGSMINVLLPTIRGEFVANTALVGWIVTGYSLAYAIGVPLYGRISELFGLRNVFVFGLIGFAIGGAICAFASSLPMLVAGRIIQGCGGAAIPALASVAVVKVLPAGGRGGAIGMIGSTVGIGSAVGPIVGGMIGQWFGWRALFVGSLILVSILIPFAFRLIPNLISTTERKFDLLGGILLGLGAGLFLFGITQAQSYGFASVHSWGFLLAAVISIIGLVWRINNTPVPFVQPQLFRKRAYVSIVLMNFFAAMAYVATLVIVPLMLTDINQLNSSQVGWVLMAGALSMALLSPVIGRMSDSVNPLLFLRGGLGLMALAFVAIACLAGSSALIIGAFTTTVAIGMALIQPTSNNAAANALDPEEVGSGMGIFSGIFFLGNAAGTALLSALLGSRQANNGHAWLPFYELNAPAFSDTFLVMIGFVLVSLVCTLGVQSRAKK